MLKLLILKSAKNETHENESDKLKKQNVPSKRSLSFILMDAYLWSNDSSDLEFLLVNMKYIDCLIQYKSSSVLNGKLPRQVFPWKMKQ